MPRLRALGYAVLVAVVVFYYLAVPLLRGLYGPEVVLPAFAAVAVLAGAVTYHAVGFLSRVGAGTDATGDETDEPAPDDRQEETGEDEESLEDLAVEKMLAELETDGEE